MALLAFCVSGSFLLLCAPMKTTVRMSILQTAVLFGEECVLSKLQCTERTREREVKLVWHRNCRLHTTSDTENILVQQSVPQVMDAEIKT